MTTVNLYLNFDGNCEAAFNFYRSVFGGEFVNLTHFKDIPQDVNMPPMPAKDLNKVMHVCLPISAETCLMGSDISSEWSAQHKVGNNCNISINVDNRQEADRLFKGLSEGGTITMPMENTFWGAYFGMFIDKFGMSWMVNFDEIPQ